MGLAARCRLIAKRKLKPLHVMPLPAFVTDVVIGTHGLETHRLMEANAAWVRQGDAGERPVKALKLQDRKERRVQRAADARTTKTFPDIRRDIDSPAVCARSRCGLA